MKILSIVLTALFLVATSSVAQIRYAFEHPADMLFVLLNFAMAICIYKVVLNSSKIRIPKNIRISLPGAISLKRQHTKVYKMS